MPMSSNANGMEEVPVSALHPGGGGFETSDDAYGQLTHPELSGVPGHAVIFSYAPPDMVRQAKLEAMELRVRRKILEHKSSRPDTHALRTDLSFAEPSTASIRVSARSNHDLGSRELVKSLVVPPELTAHGEEVRGSSEFILDGERLEYQHPGRVLADAAQGPRAEPRYRMYEHAQKTPESGAAMKKKPGEAAEPSTTGPGRKAAASGAAAGGGGGGGVGRGRGGGASGEVEGPGTTPTAAAAGGAVAGAGGGGGPVSRSALWLELRSQLSEGMMSYVPSKFARPVGVDNTAFVPQGQAMADARSQYHSVKQRRPASAPLRRPPTSKSCDFGGNAGGWGAPGAAGGPGGGSAASKGASLRDRSYNDVPVVRAEETDLLAMYRQSSQQLLQPGPGQARSGSVKLRAAGPAQGLDPAAGKGPHGAPPRGGVRQPAGAPTASAGRNSVAVLQGDGAAPKVRSRPASASPAGIGAAPRPAWAAQSPTRSPAAAPAGAKPASPAAAAKARKKPIAPATAAEAAALAAAAAGRPWSSRTGSAWPWDAARRSPNRTPASSRPVSQRRISMRRISAPEMTDGDQTGADAADAATGAAAVSAGSGSILGLRPVDPETRRQRQNRPGSAISTAKTNRLRGPAAVPHGGGAAANTAAVAAAEAADSPSPAWTSSSATGPAPCDRAQLQQRILGDLIRQQTLGADDVDSPGGDAAVRRSVGARANSDVALPGSVGGPLAAQRSTLAAVYGQESPGESAQQQYPYQYPYSPPQPQPHHGSRPQSAPNRRVRPPSAGHWAGRPDPEALLSRTGALNYSATRLVYDPELQPSLLDSYVNQLQGPD